jgi:hypothetical protein
LISSYDSGNKKGTELWEIVKQLPTYQFAYVGVPQGIKSETTTLLRVGVLLRRRAEVSAAGLLVISHGGAEISLIDLVSISVITISNTKAL